MRSRTSRPEASTSTRTRGARSTGASPARRRRRTQPSRPPPATGAAVRKALGLRSTWFGVGVVSLSPASAAPVVYGGRAKLTGLARAVSSVGMESRATTAKTWTSGGRVKPAADGTFTASVKPTTSTWYRLAVGTLRTAQVKIAVAPLVRFDVAESKTSLSGLVRPALPNALVEIQRLAGTDW